MAAPLELTPGGTVCVTPAHVNITRTGAVQVVVQMQVANEVGPCSLTPGTPWFSQLAPRLVSTIEARI